MTLPHPAPAGTEPPRGRSAQKFPDALCDAHLAGLAKAEAEIVEGAPTKEDAGEEKRLLEATSAGGRGGGGGGGGAQGMAHIEARRRKKSKWMDSTWAHRALISAQKGLSDLFGGASSSNSSSQSERRSNRSKRGGSGVGRGSKGLVDTSATALSAAKGTDTQPSLKLKCLLLFLLRAV